VARAARWLHDILSGVKLRTLGALVAAVLAVAGLAGCRTNVGTAAMVNGHRITESDVSDYLNPAGPDPAIAAQAEQSGQSLPPPRTFVLQFLVEERVFEDMLDSLGAVPSDGELAGYHDTAASLLYNAQIGGAKFDKAIHDGLPRIGVSSDLASVYIRAGELAIAIMKAKNLSDPSQLSAVAKQVGADVSVSPRYGTWSAKTLSLDTHIAVPGYLTVQSRAAAAPAN
jgi:hypothetical protein